MTSTKDPIQDQPAPVSKSYTSCNVNTFEGCFRALLESPEKLKLSSKRAAPSLTWEIRVYDHLREPVTLKPVSECFAEELL